MDPEFLEEVESLLAEAATLAGPARAALLDLRCAGYPDLRTEVESLLAAQERAGDLLHPATLAPLDSRSDDDDGLEIGARVGAYTLVESVGAGGMGRVYRAERADGEFRHEVAIKVISSAAVTAARRFRTERQILAALQHAHIVTLLDGGTTPTGHQYLVMEYVRGIPITTYCRDRRLSLADRLRLFQRVCLAVHHAHEQRIIHRDLKPSNVLVLADGSPKVLDFGVAKLLDEDQPRDATVTVFGPGPLTPNYASPEQLRGVQVTPAADIYALGVLLYELLTGVRPYETAGKPLDAVLDIVLSLNPAPPSAADPSLEDRPPYALRELAGNADAIVRRAMAKSPGARYDSVAAFADDVGRQLRGERVSARGPAAASSRARWWSGRPAAGLAGIGLVAGVLGLFQFDRRDNTSSPAAATPEARRGGTTNPAAWDAYQRGLANWRRREDLPSAVTAFREALAADAGFALAHIGLADIYAIQSAPSPEAERAIGEALRLEPALGEAHASLGFTRLFHYWDWLGAEQSLRRSVELAPDYALAHHWLGFHLMIMRRFDDARAALERAARLDPQAPAILADLGLLAFYAGDDQRAERYCREALALQPKHHFAKICLTDVYRKQGRYRDAWLVDEGEMHLPLPVGPIGVREYRSRLRTRVANPAPYPSPPALYNIAVLYAQLDDQDATIKWLQEGVKIRSFLMPFVNVEPEFNKYRNDPAFVRILTSMGLPER